jgi:hypothetical protein
MPGPLTLLAAVAAALLLALVAAFSVFCAYRGRARRTCPVCRSEDTERLGDGELYCPFCGSRWHPDKL